MLIVKGFPYVGHYNFTFPEDDFIISDNAKTFEEYKEECVYYVGDDALTGKLGFSRNLKKPVVILKEYKALDVFSVLLNTFSGNDWYGFKGRGY